MYIAEEVHNLYVYRCLAGEPSETRVSRAEVNLQVLTKMATNDECLLPLLINFQMHLPAIIELADHITGQRLHKPLASFLEQLLQVTRNSLISFTTLVAQTVSF